MTDTGSGRKIAVVLFNLGGPDGPDAVKPFLFNLFSDPAIIPLPGLVRTLVARLISSRREESAKANYAIMGGGSPLLPETVKQAQALEDLLGERLPDAQVRCFIAMRYWNPLTEETAAAVAAFGPDEIVLLPLYPQYSTTTTGSSLAAWRKAYKGSGVSRTVCCFPVEPGLVRAHADAIRQAYDDAGRPGPARLLFSAHGLPEKVILGGDPYQQQVEATCAAVMAELGAGWDWKVCYQSRVGPMKWIGPSTEDEIRAASIEGLALVVSPIAFVSEHIETLVELDHEYAAIAMELGCPEFVRVPALGIEAAFIDSLARLALASLSRTGTAPGGPRACTAANICPRTEKAA